ncbi:MAG TPA: carboxypeptidase-like regulatory domain-containing protein [Bryocella sp.]|nr:carboxypeptidase-like regulatory domain-containing protein [Bryocella sp.]
MCLLTLFLAGVAFFLPIAGRCQLSTGDILGNINDPSGAVLPGATIVLTNTETQERHTTTSDQAGEYVFTLLQPGQYSIEVSASGFKPAQIPNFALSAGDRRRVGVTMTVNGVAQSVEVSSAPPSLETDSAVLSTAVSQRAVQDLPLNGRDYVQLADLAAGANEGTAVAITDGSRPDDRRQSSAIVVAAWSDTLNNEMVEGVDNNEGTIGTIGVRPSIDAIAEFRVETNLYPAEAGKTPGAVVNLITRGGTNQLHGSVFEFLRNDALDGRNYFATVGRRPELRQNQFGGSVGGPIIRARAFFFGDYEGLRIVQGTTTVNSVPTSFEVANPGNFSDIGGPIISPSTFSTPGLNYFKLYPAPNSGTNSFIYSPNGTYYGTTADGRVDYRFNDNNLFFVRYSYNGVTVTTASGLAAVSLPNIGTIEPGGSVSYPGSSVDTADQAIMNFTHIFSPRTSLELKAGYTYISNSSLPLNYGSNFGNAMGVPNANINLFTSSLPNVGVTGFAGLGDSTSLPLYDRDGIFQYGGSLTQVRGRHTLKVGAVLIRRQIYNEEPSSGSGTYSFTSSPNNTATKVSSIVPLINLLQGTNLSVARVMQLEPRYLRSWEPSFYAQDDWRVTPILTLNIGLRYDIITPDVALGNNISQFDPPSGKILVAGINSSRTTGIQTDYRSFGPRFGFAANVRPGTVIRGGFGLVFYRDNTGPSVPFSNPPYVATYSPNNLTTTFTTPLPSPVQSSYTNPTGALRGMALNFRNSFVEQANLNIQQQLGSFVASLAYVGEFGHKLRISPDRNVAAPSPVTSPSFVTRRPFYSQYPGVTSMLHDETSGFQNYHALEAVLTRTIGHGLTLNANYTWSKALGDVQAFSAGGLYASAVPNETATLEYGNSELSVQNRFAMMLNYSLPFGQSAHGIQAALIKGWQLNAIDVWETGQPFTVTNSSPLSNTGISSDRPNQIADPNSAGSGAPINTRTHWFNTTAFASQPLGTIGTERRNMLFGPHFRHFDPSVYKDFGLSERFTLQARVEAFNVFNTPNFGQPAAVFPSATFGTITSTRTNSTPRQIQGSLRLSF